MGCHRISRRKFVRTATAGTVGLAAGKKLVGSRSAQAAGFSTIYRVYDVPVPDPGDSHHAGVDALLGVLADHDYKFYKSATDTGQLSGTDGLIAANDVVIVKVNAQWKYRGCTNSDVVKGVIQRILDHPDGFTGEVVVFENGQSGGNLDCRSTWGGDYTDSSQHANAEDESHSFSYLVDTRFAGSPVSSRLLDPIRGDFIAESEHSDEGYRILDNVSYPCFNTDGGNRIELRDGLWTGSEHDPSRLKFINIPVLKHHNGCGMTGALKHFYGVLSMEDGRLGVRHYSQIGNDCADMWCNVKTPTLTILDCIWVSPGALSGYPASNTVRTNTLLSGFDPVALDSWASKHVLYEAGGDPYHDPDQSADLQAFIAQAMDRINNTYGGVDGQHVTMSESEIPVVSYSVLSGYAGAVVEGTPAGGLPGTIALGTALLAGGAAAVSRLNKQDAEAAR